MRVQEAKSRIEETDEGVLKLDRARHVLKHRNPAAEPGGGGDG